MNPHTTQVNPFDREPSRSTRQRRALRVLPSLLILAVLQAPPAIAGLEQDLGRNDVRVYSAPLRVTAGQKIVDLDLVARLEQLGYGRVHDRPEQPGEFFWGNEVFWIYRRPSDAGVDGDLVGLSLENGRIVGLLGENQAQKRAGSILLEPVLLAEGLEANRGRRLLLELDRLPEHVWRAVLAAEDHRFFEHSGIDTRALARALVRNAGAGRLVQGGSTITQQLTKLRDMTPRRSLGRKLSEAVRTLNLEASYPKREILEAYLNAVYMGHVEGVSIHGFGAAARAYFSKPASALSLTEAALLAAMVQGPNRLAPQRHPERALQRQRWVLRRMGELGWAAAAEVAAAADRLPTLRIETPAREASPQLIGWIEQSVARIAPRRMQHGRGVVVETTLDPWLQARAEVAVIEGLQRLRQDLPKLRLHGLSAALVAIDAETGEVLASVGGDPQDHEDRFDRVRNARRQPGSALKPLIALEAIEACGDGPALYTSRRIADRSLRIDLASGPWEPTNYDDRFRGSVTLREALVDSLNVPFVRIARHCGFEATARRLRRAGLELEADPPPSFVLGSVEVTPLKLATAFSAIAADGETVQPSVVRRVRKPSRRSLGRPATGKQRVAGAGAAYLVRDMLIDAIEHGTGRSARIDGIEVFGKSGSSSGLRDAWFVGGAGSLVTVVWVGADDGTSLERTGGSAAAPIWKAFMQNAVAAMPPDRKLRPRNVVERWVQPSTGLLLTGQRRGARRELYLRGNQPARRRVLLRDRPQPDLE